MSTADDLAKQIKQADEQKRDAKKRAEEQKVILRKTIDDFDRQISSMQGMRSKASADLNTLA